MTVFGAPYADAYDLLYKEKDYTAECAMIEGLISRYGDGKPVQRLLDLGCGTGGHAIPLAERGYQVTAVDRSAEMLRKARAKAQEAHRKIDFIEGDIRQLRVGGEPNDVVIMMFAVLGYQKTPDEAGQALETARAHLRPGGLLLFDVWYGPGVTTDRPGTRERIVEQEGDRIVRTTTSTLDESEQICTVHFDVSRFRGDARVQRFQEDHVMRYFFPDELRSLAAAARFECAALLQFSDWHLDADSRTWNVVSVFRAS